MFGLLAVQALAPPVESAWEGEKRRALLAIYGDSSSWATQSEEDAKAELDAFAAFEREAADAGVLIGSWALEPEAYMLSVRDGSSRAPEQRLDCFYIVECDSVEEAKEWASKVPLVGDGGFHSIEVRPVTR